MKELLLFLSNFIKNPREVGAIAPSSRFLTREIIKHIDFEASKNIVELGPGLGAFTHAILEKSMPNTKLFCFDVNKKFCSHLNNNITDNRLKIINFGAENLSSSLKKLSIQEVECIVSGLPFLDFPDPQKVKILKEVKKSLSSKGKFVLFQYTTKLEKLLRTNFGDVKRAFVPVNLPPAFVYVCGN